MWPINDLHLTPCRNAAGLRAWRANESAIPNRKRESKGKEGVTVGDASSAKANASHIEAKISHSQGKPGLTSAWSRPPTRTANRGTWLVHRRSRVGVPGL